MAAMAGVDIVDTALSPLANGTSQPATESLVATLRGTVRDTGLDQSKLSEAAAHFRKVAARLQNEGILDSKVLRVDTNTLLYQVPGGMLSNLISQLKQAGKEDKYYDVLAEDVYKRQVFENVGTAKLRRAGISGPLLVFAPLTYRARKRNADPKMCIRDRRCDAMTFWARACMEKPLLRQCPGGDHPNAVRSRSLDP